MNCEKNAVNCEGYQQKTTWKSGKEKAEEGTTLTLTRQQSADELITSTARLRRVSLPSISVRPLPHIIEGVETPSDRVFFEHYIFRLSTIFTAEGEESNAFKDIILPMAIEHPGLMHSILALASKHIDYSSARGAEYLKRNPEVTLDALQKRSQYHDDEAHAQLHRDIEALQKSENPNAAQQATLAQMLCLVLETFSDPAPKGVHRIHLVHYQRVMKECPPPDSVAVKFIDELMQYHICADALIRPPELPDMLGSASDDWELPPAIVHAPGVRLLGVSDGLFMYMSKITNLRNDVRARMQSGEDTIVGYKQFWKAANIDAGIRAWTPAWPRGDDRDLAGQLYKHMGIEV